MLGFVLKHWKFFAAGAAALALFGFGTGAWLYIGDQIGKREAAERRADAAEQQVADLQASADSNAEKLERVNKRLDDETKLAEERLSSAQARAEAAEQRATQVQGSLNALRQRLDDESSDCDCNCGIGSDLTDQLRLDREAREADARSRDGAGDGT